jgi:DNA repair exonuclease SbcCD ATPase subunit
MRLVSVTLRNYRIHRELTVDLDRPLTVIGGPNETGKTTIVEAIHRALFLRSRASGAVLDSMRSHFHPGHPAVELTFECGGGRWTVTKQFTGTNTAPTTLACVGGGTLRSDEAERKLKELVAAEAIGGRNVEERLRMQWAHLWVWQGAAADDPFAGDALREPLDRLRARLGSLEEGSVTESRLDAAVARAVADAHAARTRDDGTPRVDSPLGRAATALEAARSRVRTARAAIATLEAAVATVERADTAIVESDRSLAARRAEQETNERLLREAQALQVLQAEQQAAAHDTTARLATLAEGDRQVRDCAARIADIEARRAPAAERHAATVVTERDIAARCTAARDAARGRQREQAEVAELAELHRQAEHLEQRRAERAGLAGRCGRIAVLRAEAAELQARRDALPPVSAADLADLSACERSRDAAQAKLDAIATRVEVMAAATPVRLGGQELAVGRPETITADTTLEVAGARLVITPGGGTSLAEATRLRDDAVAALADRLRGMSVADVDEARRIQPLRQTLEAALAAKQAAIADLGDVQADRDLAALDAEIGGLEAVLEGPVRAGFMRPVGLDAAVAARQAIAVRLRDLAAAQATADAEQQGAEQLAAEARGQRETAADAVAAIDRDLRDARVRLEVLIEEHGDRRDDALAAATRDRDDADARLAATRSALARLQPDLLRETSGRLGRAIENLLTAVQTARAERTIALERLRSEGTLDPREDLATAIAAERNAEATQRHADREARAHALLARLFAEKKAEIEARFVAPLADRVAGYLRCLFGADTAVTVGYEADAFTTLELSRPDFGSVSLPFKRLSGGTREQVGAAFRLAMAEILAGEHGGCLPIVLDDAFVNSDPGRVAAIQAMLDRAAGRGLQVIVLSCNHRDYDALGAVAVDLPRPTVSDLAPVRREEPPAADTDRGAG